MHLRWRVMVTATTATVVIIASYYDTYPHCDEDHPYAYAAANGKGATGTLVQGTPFCCPTLPQGPEVKGCTYTYTNTTVQTDFDDHGTRYASPYDQCMKQCGMGNPDACQITCPSPVQCPGGYLPCTWEDRSVSCVDYVPPGPSGPPMLKRFFFRGLYSPWCGTFTLAC